MAVFEILYQIFIGPLRLIMETVYGIAYDLTGSVGGSIIPLSLAINFLLLPLYRRADALQRENRDLEARMAPMLTHIKQHFHGDERFMMIQACYRINHYKPLYALRSALPLLLQVPFFIAAYSFLSHLSLFEKMPYGLLLDLSQPDAMYPIGSATVNVLPILMTLINILSSEIYTRGMAFREKLKVHAIALIFLVLLYNAPCGLVLYWTLNNIFSLIKNLVMKSKNPPLIARILVAALFLAAFACALFLGETMSPGRIYIFIGVVALVVLVLIYTIKRNPGSKRVDAKDLLARYASHPFVFFVGAFTIAALTGLLIPSAVIKASPAEFVLTTDYQSPVIYVFNAFLTACGLFVVWLGLFYKLSTEKARKIFEFAIWGLIAAGLVNYMAFGRDLGMLSELLRYEFEPSFSINQMIINFEVAIAAFTAVTVLCLKRVNVVRAIGSLVLAVIVGMSLFNTVSIQSAMPKVQQAIASNGNSHDIHATLSRKGKNVVVIMLDRAVSGLIPYIFNEKPELTEQFDGFVYYPNTISYGPATNTGSPGLYGGYEYIPEEMNKRDDLPLAEKHNEALLVMPRVFDEAGYHVTVFDPSYAGYTWIPDLSIYEDYPNIRAYNTTHGEVEGTTEETNALRKRIWNRNFFCFGLMKISPLMVQHAMYQNGSYYSADQYQDNLYIVQIKNGASKAVGMSGTFVDCFNVLHALPDLTVIDESEQNSFFVMCNKATHEPILLSEPDYLPRLRVDNTEYDEEHGDRFTVNGRTVDMNDGNRMASYHSNMAAVIQLGQWFDYLRREGIYDNTRIIIVSDHGTGYEFFSDMLFSREDGGSTESFNSLLMVKDFGAKGFATDDTFMTNADTPTLAFADLIDEPTNPFTGNKITNDKKLEPEQHIFYTKVWQTDINNGKKFLPGKWLGLRNQNIFDMDNWEFLGDR